MENVKVINGNILINGDCSDVMKVLGEQGVKVDAIIADIPYQITACEWDTLIPFNNHLMLPKTKRSKKLVPVYRDEYILRELQEGREYSEICEYFDKNSIEGMWQKLNKLIKPNGAIALFGSEPFSSALRMSNIKNFKYDWIWEKSKSSTVFLAKKQPMKYHEIISVFYKMQCVYNPQMTIQPKDKQDKRKITSKYTSNKSSIIGEKNTIRKVETGLRYPKSVQLFNNSDKTKNVHPTQKPVSLMEYLVKTYSKEGEIVLDFTMGSGTTGVACKNTNRKFIGIELDKKYYDIAVKRMEGEL